MFALSSAVPLREDFTVYDLRRLARASRDAGQSRRLLALAAVYDGGSRIDAARIGAVSLQTVRDWASAFNADGPVGLIDRKAPGNPPKLDAAQRQALAPIIERGPDLDRHGVVRWRLKDLAAWVNASFGVQPGREHARPHSQADGLSSQAVGLSAPSRAGSGCPDGVQKNLPAAVAAIRTRLPPDMAIELW